MYQKNYFKNKKSLKKKICLHFIKANEKNKNQKTLDSILKILLKKIFQDKIA